MGNNAQTQKLQAAARRSRQAVLDYLTDKLTDPANPMTVEQMNELRATWIYFPEGRKMVDQIEVIYSEKPELRKAVLLGAIIACLERLL